MQLWFELYRPPSGRESDLLEEMLASWFMLGRLGAYNAQNLQVPLSVACILADSGFQSAKMCLVTGLFLNDNCSLQRFPMYDSNTLFKHVTSSLPQLAHYLAQPALHCGSHTL